MSAVPPIRFGLVGGGQDAFIGAVHRQAARLDGQFTLVCGALSRNPERAVRSGLDLGLPLERSHADYRTMFAIEAQLPEAERMQCVVIVTPNRSHLPIASAALAAGFHVFSDKPATASFEECRALARAVAASGRHYALTHPYTGYPMIREARERIARGDLGRVRKILVEYTQGWLASPIEREGQKQASWRLDPAEAGASCCFGDIGVHAFNLAEFATGRKVTALSATLQSVVPGRVLDDDGAAMLRFDEGASGVLVASQVCTGDENDVRLRVYGERASLGWRQMEPNTLWLKHADAPAVMLRTGAPGVGAAAAAATRLPSGHPEGFIEAFGNLYRDFASLLRGGEDGAAARANVQGIDAALRGMAFIETAVQSSAAGGAWMSLPSTNG
jgi:predicted dehydrogenase